MLRQVGAGTFVPVENDDPQTLRTYALRDGKNLRVMLDNLQDPASAGERKVVVKRDGRYRHGDFLRLSGPALDAKTGITLGGNTVSNDGTFPPVTRTPLKVSGRTLSITLPAASATLVSLTP
jgi:glycosyl hydrolase family 79